jgi:microsomal dipeptidase-like Zn-dependent dipeptidase
MKKHSSLVSALRFAFVFAAVLSAGMTYGASDPSNPIVDLHAHLFFYEGMGTSLLGGFRKELGNETWDNFIFPKVNEATLQKSGSRIVVVALYAHPLFLVSERESIRRQIQAAEDFVSTHPAWMIARSAEEASSMISQGKRVLIFSLEGASGVLETEADLAEFIDRRGIRIVTPVHFTDDRIGGACFMPGLEIVTNPWAALKSLKSPHHDSLGVRTNPTGLRPDGHWLVESLLKRGVWIDLSHTSDATYRDLVPLLRLARQPLLYTHTVLRAHFRAERGITPERLDRVRMTQGIVGVLPSDDMLSDTEAEPIYCPSVCAGACNRGIPVFLTQYSEIAGHLGDSASVMIGSDINAPLRFLGPACPAEAQQSGTGLANYGQLIELWQALRKVDLISADPDTWTNRFLYVWSQVRPLTPPPQIVPTTPTAKTVPGSG